MPYREPNSSFATKKSIGQCAKGGFSKGSSRPSEHGRGFWMHVLNSNQLCQLYESAMDWGPHPVHLGRQLLIWRSWSALMSKIITYA